MDSAITVFTTVPRHYEASSEFSLSLKIFRESLPADSLLVITAGNKAASLRSLIVENIPGIVSPYVLILKEPAFLISDATIKTMMEIMALNPEILCVLPSDSRGFRPGRDGSYYTLRGFEKFIDSLSDLTEHIMPYDGREALMFLIRADVLSQMEIPEDPLSIPKFLPQSGTCIALNAYIHSFLSYYDEVRTDILPFIPEGVTTLLDIGCSSGNFGAAVRNKFGCRVVGVEVNPYEARRARSKLDLVIEEGILSADITEKFDCITCLDVLEHIENTGAFLEKVRTLLSDNGYLLLSVPNIGHWSIVEDLLAGRWDYAPAGILCITHLRFFTKRSIEAVLKQAGFSVVSVRENNTPLPGNQNNWMDLIEKAGIEINKESLCCLGYYITAKKFEPLK